MSFSLDTPTAASFKAEARLLREERARQGASITHSAALEEIARRHGYRDWNTAVAAVPERVTAPVQVGDRVRGTYLSQPFVGMVLGVRLLSTAHQYEVTVKFDQPVDVVKSKLFSAFRQRVTATVDLRGISLARTSDGEPHMRVRKI